MAADTPLTDRQLSILRAIHELTRERGLPPTMRAVAGRVGCSVEVVWDEVHALRARGCLVPAAKGAPRALRLTDRGLREIGVEPTVEVPARMLAEADRALTAAIERLRFDVPGEELDLLSQASDAIGEARRYGAQREEAG